MRSPALTLALVAAAAGSAGATPVEVSLSWVNGRGRMPAQVAVEPLIVVAAGDPAPEWLVTAGIDGTARLELPAGRFRLRARAEGFWGAPHEIETPPDTSVPLAVTLRLWPLATLSVPVRAPQGSVLPPTARVIVSSAPGIPSRSGRAAVPRSELVCPVEGATLSCPAPAALLDIELRAASFVPHYLWDVELKAAAVRSLDPVQLVQGGSIAGWVKRAQGAATQECRVTLLAADGRKLRPGHGPGGAPAQQVDVAPNRRGFFQLRGLGPADYRLGAGDGLDSLEETLPVSVARDAETLIKEPLVLAAAPSLEVHVAPPLDNQGRPWRVAASSMDGPRALNAEGLASPDGQWARGGLPNGRYRISVIEDSSGARWHSEMIELERGAGPFLIATGIRSVRGTLKLGKQPLAARVLFGGSFGAAQVVLQSDEHGSFAGYLPKTERPIDAWPVQIRSEQPSITRYLKLTIPASDSDARVDIVLPDTSIKGLVVDEEGLPVQGAIVNAAPSTAPAERMTQTFSDEAGRFALRGLEPGRYEVFGEASAETAMDSVQTTLKEAEEVSLRLVARRQLVLTGQVVSSQGAVVPGARVSLRPAGSRRSSGDRADAEGRFKLPLPPHTTELDLRVEAEGFALKLARIPVPERRQLTVALQPDGGRLVLEIPEGSQAPPEWKSLVLIHDGATTDPLSLFGSWARRQPDGALEPLRMVIPQMEAGDYMLCFESSLGSPQRCARATLLPGQESLLKAPKS